MEILTIDTFTTNEAKDAASKIISQLKESKILLLSGELGTGKTTLTKHICNYLGYMGEVTSPTYAIVNEYLISDTSNIYHMDLYRIKDVEELDEIGFLEYLDSNHYCIIEWPELAIQYLDIPFYHCTIKHKADSREYSLNLEMNKV